MIKIVSIAIICSFLILYLKIIKSEFFPLALVGAGIIIVYLGLDYLSDSFDFIKSIISYSGLSNDMLSIILKITGIGVLINFGTSTIEDMGYSGLAEKVSFVGKLCIISISIPIFKGLLDLIINFFQ